MKRNSAGVGEAFFLNWCQAFRTDQTETARPHLSNPLEQAREREKFCRQRMKESGDDATAHACCVDTRIHSMTKENDPLDALFSLFSPG